MSEQQSSCALADQKSGTVEYRTIERFPGYKFGSDGSVWSSWRTRGGMVNEWYRMTPGKHRNGYLSVQLRTGPCERKFMLVHQVILEAFVGPCPPGCEVRHFPDREKTNCSAGNLSWATRSVNAKDRATHGTQCRGETNGRHKLTAAIVIQCRELFAAGETVAAMANRHGVDFSTMQSAVLRKTWKTVA